LLAGLTERISVSQTGWKLASNFSDEISFVVEAWLGWLHKNLQSMCIILLYPYSCKVLQRSLTFKFFDYFCEAM